MSVYIEGACVDASCCRLHILYIKGVSYYFFVFLRVYTQCIVVKKQRVGLVHASCCRLHILFIKGVSCYINIYIFMYIKDVCFCRLHIVYIKSILSCILRIWRGGGLGSRPKKCTGRGWGMGWSTI